MTYQLTLELGGLHPVLLRAALVLHRDPRLRVTTRLVRSSYSMPDARVLRLELGSVVRPLVTVLWNDGSEANECELAKDAAAGASRACWYATNGNETWQRLATPLPNQARIGTPAIHRPWVLVAPEIRVHPRRLEDVTGMLHAQAHRLRLTRTSLGDDGVVWLPSRRAIESLLGHVDAVLAPSGPLAWDAARANVPVFAAEGSKGTPPDLTACRLARVVPEQLASDEEFWRGLVADILNGSGAVAWGTRNWLRLAHSRPLPQAVKPSRPSPFRRKLRKLRRNPHGFWADSKLANLAKNAGFRGS
jgi:hypothetical protein